MIKVRNRKLSFDESKVDSYYRDDKYLTAFWNTLSQLFPEGEKFFVDSVRIRAGDQPSADTRAFIGQEAMHSREHDKFNKLINVPGQKEIKYLLDIARKLPTEIQLEITVALEHYTSVMAEQLLTNEKHNTAIRYGYVDLWLWHAIEECEHNAVAYNLSRSNYIVRIFVFTITSIMFFLFANLWYWHMLFKKRLLNPIKLVKAYAELAWLFKDLVPEILSYYSPLFHPRQVNKRLLLRWIKQLELE